MDWRATSKMCVIKITKLPFLNKVLKIFTSFVFLRISSLKLTLLPTHGGTLLKSSILMKVNKGQHFKRENAIGLCFIHRPVS